MTIWLFWGWGTWGGGGEGVVKSCRPVGFVSWLYGGRVSGGGNNVLMLRCGSSLAMFHTLLMLRCGSSRPASCQETNWSCTSIICLGVLLEILQSWMWSWSLERTWHAHEVGQPQNRLLEVISSGRQIKKTPVATCGQVFDIHFFQKSSFRYSENQGKFILRRASNSFFFSFETWNECATCQRHCVYHNLAISRRYPLVN